MRRRSATILLVLSTSVAVLAACCCAATQLWLLGYQEFKAPSGRSASVGGFTPIRIKTYVLVRGHFQATVTDLLTNSPATASGDSGWFHSEAVPLRRRNWDDRCHLTRWNEWRLGDFGWYTTAGGGATSRVFSLPLWMPFAAGALPAMIVLPGVVRPRRWRRSGHCEACGHDRTGIDLMAVYPECGRMPRRAPRAAPPPPPPANTPAP